MHATLIYLTAGRPAARLLSPTMRYTPLAAALCASLVLTSCDGSEPSSDTAHPVISLEPLVVRVSLTAGSSNCKGGGDHPDLSPVPTPGTAYVWNDMVSLSIRPLVDPAFGTGVFDRSSMWPQYAIRAYELTGEVQLIVGGAVGETKLHATPGELDWNLSSGELLPAALAKWAAAMAAAEEAFPNATVLWGPVLWNHGNDLKFFNGTSRTQATYQRALVELIDAFQAARPTSPFILATAGGGAGEDGRGLTPEEQTALDAFRQMERQTVAVHPNAYLGADDSETITAHYLAGEPGWFQHPYGHWSLNAFRLVGPHMAEAWADIAD